MRVVFDIETDGLEPTKIFLICAKIVGKNMTYEFYDAPSWREWITQMGVEELIGHNIIGFDLPVLRKLWNWEWKGAITDTLVLSRLGHPSREGGHSLKAWGSRCGFEKLQHDDFTTLSEDMVAYCIRDVLVTEQTVIYLERELNAYSEQSIRLEHDVAQIIKEQEENGWKLDERKATMLLRELVERRERVEKEVGDSFPTLYKREYVDAQYKKDGTLFKKFEKLEWDEQRGKYYKVITEKFNIASRQQIIKRLKGRGWKPNTLTEKGNVKMDEKVLSTITDIPEAKLLSEYFLLAKRIVMVEAWIEAVSRDGRVHGRVNSCGAISGRMTHNSPNLAQVPASYSPYGKQCRELWIVERGMRLVGVDASGLELRLLAHYLKDENYVRAILDGDVHSYNQRLAGLDTRDQAKTFIYAFIYGAGNGKLGEIIGGTRKDGAKLRKRFLSNLPNLKALRGGIERVATRGVLKGLDGRKLQCRSPHSALNLLLQGAGAIVMKQALFNISKSELMLEGRGKFVGNIHDEIQMECEEEYAEELGGIAVEQIKQAGTHFNLRCPMDAEYRIGSNWSETH